MAGSWLLFFVVLATCAAVVALAAGQRTRTQQVEAGRFRLLTARMREVDAALADFEAEFADRVDATADRVVGAANGSMDGVRATAGDAATATRQSIAASTRMFDVLRVVKKNYEDLEALATGLSAGERERMRRVSEVMRARHAELSSRIKGDGLTQVVDAVESEQFTAEPGLRKAGVVGADTKALDAAVGADLRGDLSLRESLYYRMSAMPEVMQRARDLVAAKPESPVFRMLRELRASNAAGLSLLRTEANSDAAANSLLAELAAVGAEKTAAMSKATSGMLDDLRKSFAALATTQKAAGVAQTADETAAAALAAAKVSQAAAAAAATASRDQTLSAAARKTAADWAVTANNNYLAAALRAEDAAMREEQTTSLLALARAEASDSAASANVDRYKRIAALWSKAPPPWDRTPIQRGLLEYLGAGTRGALRCALSVRRISQAYDGPLFRLQCAGAAPETQDFWAAEPEPGAQASVLSSQPNGLGTKVDMWSGGSPVRVLAWFDQSGAGSHAVFGDSVAPPTLNLYGNSAVNVAFDAEKGLRLPDAVLPAAGVLVVSLLHGTAEPGARFFGAGAFAFGASAAAYTTSTGADVLAAGRPSKGANVMVVAASTDRVLQVNNVEVGKGSAAAAVAPASDVAIGGRHGAPGDGVFTLNRMYVLHVEDGKAAVDDGDLEELNRLPGA